ncbi:hypothetical protein L3X38_000904 [Prunus dulcis]|uniref:Non-haem dioxygenase N-terminal domain-containing protein n=1 Tax=Prunus dulcis TaxID=3755 RepID=A0AAD4WTI4_PRUDU|nr:hypothetical protein L3X38_000904 [Prunus dulcis]
MIDLKGISQNDAVYALAEVVGRVGYASEKWSLFFFQIVNHGISLDVLDRMIHGIREFHDSRRLSLRKDFIQGSLGKNVFYMSNNDLYQSSEINWKDTLACYVDPDPHKPEELPLVCR